jgi:large subunit ribosomal protein L19
MSLITEIEKEFKKEIPAVKPGDEVALHLKVVESGKERTQVFKGTVIAMRGNGTGATMTVRKVSYGEGVERIVPIYSPILKKIEILKSGKSRRAKLYHLRDGELRSAH